VIAAVRTMPGMRALALEEGLAAMLVRTRAVMAARSGMTGLARVVLAGATRPETTETRAPVVLTKLAMTCAPAAPRARADKLRLRELAVRRAQAGLVRVRGLAGRRARAVWLRVRRLDARRQCRPPPRRCCTGSGTSGICRRVARWSATGFAWLYIRLLRIAVLAWL